MFYRGTGVPGKPGFNMEEFEGFPVSRCGNYWGTGPVDSEGFLIVDKPKFEHKSKYHK